jgi:hypothetical protein
MKTKLRKGPESLFQKVWVVKQIKHVHDLYLARSRSLAAGVLADSRRVIDTPPDPHHSR